MTHIPDPIAIAIYLPQYHPIPENDTWWGKGFTEWTNVGKAKKLFKGHYQPRVPADLGYYDLRMEETRIAQAQMAKKYGIQAFCYWNYWFGNGKKLLECPLEEVLASGKPDFPICIGWANHSWEAKNWGTKKLKNKILINQEYPSELDCINHYKYLSRAFKDDRYFKVNGKPLFVIWDPLSLPTEYDYLKIWNKLALDDGFPGIEFIGFTYHKDKIDKIREAGFDNVLFDGLFEARNAGSKLVLFARKIIREILSLPIRVKYNEYARINEKLMLANDTIPCILPNYDHTPRSGKRGVVLISTPNAYENHLAKVVTLVRNGQLNTSLIFIKSWNEWGEGNHLEPDLKYGLSYLESTFKALSRRL